ncbi:hypothetical protein [Aeoliella mucimassa]|nr:hypothetical protein [Aeoliella mucimassa]
MVGCAGPKYRNVGVGVSEEEQKAAVRYAAENDLTYDEARRELSAANPTAKPKLLQAQESP